MIKPGSVSDFENSMAKAIAQAFQTEWDAVKSIPLNAAGEEDRNIMFAAIAQGVVKHLQEQINTSLKVRVDLTTGRSNLVELQSE